MDGWMDGWMDALLELRLHGSNIGHASGLSCMIMFIQAETICKFVVSR